MILTLWVVSHILLMQKLPIPLLPAVLHPVKQSLSASLSVKLKSGEIVLLSTIKWAFIPKGFITATEI